MKMTKTVLVAAAVAALALVGCKKNVGDVTISQTATGASVDFENTGDEIARGFSKTTLKHSGCVMDITMANQTATSADGMMGTIFDLTTNKDGTYNFYIVGIANWNGKARTYVSRYENIAEADMSGDNFGATAYKAAAFKDATGPKELEVKPLGTNAQLKYTIDADGNYAATIQVEPALNGDFVVKYFPAGTKFEKNDETGLWTAKDDVACYDIVTIAGAHDEVESISKYPQGGIAYYANVYAGKTLTGSWKLSCKVNEAVEE